MTDKMTLTMALENVGRGAHMAGAYVDPEDGTATIELLERMQVGWKNITLDGVLTTSADVAEKFDDLTLTREAVAEDAAEAIAPEDGLTLEELGEAMIDASPYWDGDEAMHSIVLRFIRHYAELDAEIHAARESADFEDDAVIMFRWDSESGALVRADAPVPDGQPSDAAVIAFLNHFYSYDPPVTDMAYWSPESSAHVRAALRAAGRAR